MRLKNQLLTAILFFLFSPFVQGQSMQIDTIITNFYKTDSLGVSRIYYKNGHVEEEGKFIRKKMNLFSPRISVCHGLWRFYYKNGNLKKRGTYNKGDKDGLWEFFNKKGQLMQIVLYKKNKIVDERIYIKEIPIWEKAKFKNKKGIYIAD